MKRMSEIILSESDINRLKRKYIGSGTEANIYRVDEGILYKLYKPYDVLAEEFGFFDENEIKNVYSDVNIRIAMERQPYVNLTSLPICPIYDKNYVFIGCALKEHRFCFPIQAAIMLPRKKQIDILKRLLYAVKELCDNKIYHQDLATKEIDGKKHSNVLVTLTGNPEMIDLDGKSTLYTIERNENYEWNSYVFLGALIAEILFDVDSKDDIEDIDIEWGIKKLMNQGLDSDLAEKLLRYETGYDSLNEILRQVKKK